MSENKINLIIPAAGEASRLRPISSNCSKVMVRVNGKPCLEWILEEARKNAYIVNTIIVTGKFDDVEDYVSKVYKEGVHCVKQGSLDGPRDAIQKGFKKLEEVGDINLPCVVWLGDTIVVDKELPLGTDFLLTKKVLDRSKWCMWNGFDFYNKPSTNIENGVALVGVYSFANGSAASTAFTKVKSYDISDAIDLGYICVIGADFVDVDVGNNWYDIGEVSSYHETCARLMNKKARSFNRFRFDSELHTITKYPDYSNSDATESLRTEKNWYNNLNDIQQVFTPKIVGGRTHCYEIEMEHIGGVLLSDLLLFDNLSPSFWETIIERIVVTIKKYFHSSVASDEFVKHFKSNLREMWVTKTADRIGKIGGNEQIFSDVNDIGSDIAYHSKCIRPVGCVHGDLHLGNIIYDSNINKLTFIDPRGKYGSISTNEGDNLYDWAKLAHDLYFGYNAMVADVNHPEFIKDIFIKVVNKHLDIPIKLILDAGCLLLASCIPLHNDNKARQTRFINKVKEYIRNEKHSI